MVLNRLQTVSTLYMESRTQGPLGSHPFSHPARSFLPASANEHP